MILWKFYYMHLKTKAITQNKRLNERASEWEKKKLSTKMMMMINKQEKKE